MDVVGSAERRVKLRLIQGGSVANDSAEESTQGEKDSVLVAAVQRGEPAAATAFHDRIRGVVDRTLRRLLGVRDVDYDDLAQQSLIELVTSLHRFRGGHADPAGLCG